MELSTDVTRETRLFILIQAKGGLEGRERWESKGGRNKASEWRAKEWMRERADEGSNHKDPPRQTRMQLLAPHAQGQEEGEREACEGVDEGKSG